MSTLGEILIERYIGNPNVEFAIILLFIAFLIGFLSLTIRFLINEKGDKTWIKLNPLDKVGISIVIGLTSLIVSAMAFLICNLITNFFLGMESFSNIQINRIIVVIIAFLYPFWISDFYCENVRGFDYLKTITSFEKGLFSFIIFAIILIGILFGFFYSDAFLGTLFCLLGMIIACLVYKKRKH